MEERVMVRSKRSRLGGGISVLLGALLALTLAVPATGAAAEDTSGWRGHGKNPGSYTNPLLPQVPGDGAVESCADPTVIRGQQPGDTTWYLYCTTDPLNDEDLDANGNL